MLHLVTYTHPDLAIISAHVADRLIDADVPTCIVLGDQFKDRLPFDCLIFGSETPRQDLLARPSLVAARWKDFVQNAELFSYCTRQVFIGCPEEEDILTGDDVHFFTEHGSVRKPNAFDTVTQLDTAPSTALPITETLLLTHGPKAVTAIALDTAGSRLFSGSIDGSVRLWDFHSLSRTDPRPFRELSSEHLGTQQIHALRFGALSGQLMAVSDSSQARFFSRDGQFAGETARGDMYIRDLKNTCGHVGPLSSADWHPTQADVCVTGGRDGTVRTWSTAALSTHKDLVVVKSGKMHRPTPVTFCAYSEQLIWTAAADGNVRAYPAGGPFSRPAIEFHSGVNAGSEISSMAFADSQLISRSTDSMLRIWDTRSTKQQKGTVHPVASHSLPCKYPETQVVLSPTSDFFLTGTQGATDSLQIFSASSHELVKSIDAGPAISLCWHPQLNQIFAGLADGRVAVLYDSVLSRKGALLSSAKKSSAETATGLVYTPHSLPLFDSVDDSLRTRRRNAPLISALQPEAPVAGHGSGGRIGTNATAKIIRTLLPSHDDVSADPRELLLQHAEAAEQDPFWATPAYRPTQHHQSSAAKKSKPTKRSP